MAKNKVISIGCLGTFHNFVNVPMEEAIKRHNAIWDQPELTSADSIMEWEFDDEFHSYDGGYAP